MVTAAPAHVLRLPDAGRIAANQPADLIVVPAVRETAADALVAARRADLGGVVIGGRPMIGDQRFRPVFNARGVDMRPVSVDGTEHVAAASLVRDIARCAIQEPGVLSVA
jgi:cytosine/adenosine deaminase-related metal-dependent hydrolase